MALYTVTTGSTIAAPDVNQVVDELDRQSGQQEVGKYIAIGSAYTTNCTVGVYYPSRSRYASPISASVDSADVALSGVTSLSIGHLSSSGVQIYATSTAAGTNIGTGGNVTIQY